MRSSIVGILLVICSRNIPHWSATNKGTSEVRAQITEKLQAGTCVAAQCNSVMGVAATNRTDRIDKISRKSDLFNDLTKVIYWNCVWERGRRNARQQCTRHQTKCVTHFEDFPLNSEPTYHFPYIALAPRDLKQTRLLSHPPVLETLGSARCYSSISRSLSTLHLSIAKLCRK